MKIEGVGISSGELGLPIDRVTVDGMKEEIRTYNPPREIVDQLAGDLAMHLIVGAARLVALLEVADELKGGDS